MGVGPGPLSSGREIQAVQGDGSWSQAGFMVSVHRMSRPQANSWGMELQEWFGCDIPKEVHQAGYPGSEPSRRDKTPERPEGNKRLSPQI